MPIEGMHPESRDIAVGWPVPFCPRLNFPALAGTHLQMSELRAAAPGIDPGPCECGSIALPLGYARPSPN